MLLKKYPKMWFVCVLWISLHLGTITSTEESNATDAINNNKSPNLKAIRSSQTQNSVDAETLGTSIFDILRSGGPWLTSDVSKDCREAFRSLFSNATTLEERKIARKMVDAWGKIPSRLFISFSSFSFNNNHLFYFKFLMI